MTNRGAWHRYARQLADDGLSTREIAERVGVTTSAVYKALNPERAKRYWDKQNATPGTRERKRAQDRAAIAYCVDCGGPCGVASRYKKRKRCVACHVAHVSRVERYQELWHAGYTLAQIADQMGLSGKNSAQHIIWRYRQLGYDFPYRRDASALANIRRAANRRWAARRKVAA